MNTIFKDQTVRRDIPCSCSQYCHTDQSDDTRAEASEESAAHIRVNDVSHKCGELSLSGESMGAMNARMIPSIKLLPAPDAPEYPATIAPAITMIMPR